MRGDKVKGHTQKRKKSPKDKRQKRADHEQRFGDDNSRRDKRQKDKEKSKRQKETISSLLLVCSFLSLVFWTFLLREERKDKRQETKKEKTFFLKDPACV